jgi:hypothetical protein
MKTSLAKGLGAAIVTEVAADTAVIGGVMAARGKAPLLLPVVAGCVAAAGLALLVRMLPVLEKDAVKMAAEKGWLDKAKAAS